MLQINNLSVRYPGKDWLFQDVSFALNRGETLLVRGANGSGKTTLLYAISNVIPSMIEAEKTGEVLLDDELLNNLLLQNLIPKLSLMLCNPLWELFFTNPEEEIIFALENMGLSETEMEKRIKTVLKDFGIGEWLRFPTHKLSAGWQKMVVLALQAAIIPQIMLLDEPLNGLSKANIELVLNWMKKYAKEGGILIMAEHSQHVETLKPSILQLGR